MMYLVRVLNEVTKDYPVLLEFERERFTKRDFDNIVLTLFYLAAEGIENRQLVADVFRAETRADVWTKAAKHDIGTAFTVYCNTFVDGSTIDAYVRVNGNFYRKMNIAS